MSAVVVAEPFCQHTMLRSIAGCVTCRAKSMRQLCWHYFLGSPLKRRVFTMFVVIQAEPFPGHTSMHCFGT